MDNRYYIDVLNNQIYPQIDIDQSFYMMSVKEIIKILKKYRNDWIKKGTAKSTDKLKAVVIDGALYLNNDFVGRIAPKKPRPVFDEESYYIEGKILARQEII